MSEDNTAIDVETEVTKPTEKDVLMGRGKRASEWPGNVFFRQCVNKHRPEYARAGRNEKVKIAAFVIKEIRDAGGRFLGEEKFGDAESHTVVWTEVEEARVVEKTCQALREKEKSKTSDKPPFVGENVAEQMLQRHRLMDKRRQEKMLKEATAENGGKRKSISKKKKGAKAKKKQRMECSDDESDSSSSDESSSSVEKGASSRSGKRRKMYIESPDAMLDRLRKFQLSNGHTAVPTDWKEDIILADWCTAQRQLYREVESGFRTENKQHGTEQGKEDSNEIAEAKNDGNAEPKNNRILSTEEQKVLDTLREMDFCWDYEDWHWNRKYISLMDDQSRPSNNLTEWVREQKRLYREGELSDSRIKKLKQAGVTLL